MAIPVALIGMWLLNASISARLATSSKDVATEPAGGPSGSGAGQHSPPTVGLQSAATTATPVVSATASAPSASASGKPSSARSSSRPSSSSRAAGSHVPSGKGCAAAPSACGYPDATTTGVPHGVSLRRSGSVTASKTGQVVQGLDITGEINVTASNVIIRNTRVTGSGDWVVIVRGGANNLTIEDSELQTPAGTPQDIACVLNIGDSHPQILRVNIHGCSAGVSSGGGLVKDSYIHDMSQKPGLSHDVGVASNGSGGMSVVHNTIFNQLDQTAAIAFYQDFGTQRNDLVENNLLAGGGYCVYGGTGSKGATADIRFVNNRFSRKYHSGCGAFGVVADFAESDPGNVWSGNYWDDTLSPVGS